MLGPAPAAWLLVVLSTAVGISCVLRMRGAVRRKRRAGGSSRASRASTASTAAGEVTAVGEGMDAVMGFGMAVMAVPVAALAPPAWTWRVSTGVFVALALFTAWSSRRGRHRLHHLIGTLAMAYMTAVMAWGAGPPGGMHHAGHGGSGAPVLTGVLLLYFAGHVLWSGARLLAAEPPAAQGTAQGAARGSAQGAGAGAAHGGWLTCPELVRACRLSLSIGMLAMLFAL